MPILRGRKLRQYRDAAPKEDWRDPAMPVVRKFSWKGKTYEGPCDGDLYHRFRQACDNHDMIAFQLMEELKKQMEQVR